VRAVGDSARASRTVATCSGSGHGAARPASVVSVSLLLDAMLPGPAAMAGARYGTHDWKLLSVSEREFRMLRSQFHELWQTR
jgi:hypothetical protein